jgi:16S rRNA processing protein RimM
MEKERFVSVGRVSGTHGFKGTLKLKTFTESTSFFEPDSEIHARHADGKIKRYTVGWIKPRKKGLLVFFKETADFEQARELVGAELLVERSRLPEPEEGSYYWVDLIGLKVFTVDGDCIGVLNSIFRTGSNDVYVVKDGDAETLVPALESVVRKVDLENRAMIVRLPEGL